MAKNKKTNRQIIAQKTKHRKLKTKQREPHQKLGVISGAPEGKQILLHMWHPSCCLCYYKSGKNPNSVGQNREKGRVLWLRHKEHIRYHL